MTGERFENRLNKDNIKFNTLNPIWDNERGDALNVFEMIDELIRLNLDCSNLIDDNTEYVAEINQIHKENEQLKQNLRMVEKRADKVYEENEQLKDILKDITIQLDANHTMNTYQMVIPINRVIYNELNRRLKETSFNEELKRVLDD